MSFLDHLQSYYNVERTTALVMALAGVPVTGLAAWLWRAAAPESIARGLMIPLLLLGLLLLGAGAFNTYNNGRRLVAFSAQYQERPTEFLAKEIPRMEGIRTWWLPLRIMWTVFLVAGSVLIFMATREYWVGVALGLLVVGTAGHILDGFAYENNEAYTKEILKLKA